MKSSSTRESEHAGLWALIGLMAALPFAAWYGFVIKTLWGWFVVPVGAPVVGVWEAAGLYLLIRLLTTDTTLPRDDERTPAEKCVVGMATGIILPAFALAFGAIYHAFA